MNKIILCSFFVCTCIFQHLTAQKISLGKVIWDDFNYSLWNDKAAADFGWRFRTGLGWPSKYGVWSEKQVTFLNDPQDKTNRIMRFTSYTNGIKGDSTVQCQASKQPPVCRFGTYASRVRFSAVPATGPDVKDELLTQTFYTIVGIEGEFAEPLLPDSLKKYKSPLQPHSEMDFEYLPHGGWGTKETVLFTTSHNPGSTQSGSTDDYTGWHTLWITIDSVHWTYYCDDKALFTHTGDIPDLNMSLNYNQWFIQLGDPGKVRTYVEDIDWVLYTDKKFLTYNEINKLVGNFRSKNLKRLDKDLKGKNIYLK